MKVENIKKELNKNLLKSLKSYRNSGVIEFVEILATKNSCDACKKMEGIKISLEDAIIKNPLPIKECSHKCGYCKCCYIPLVN